MNPQRLAYIRLHQLLSGLEDNILRLDDREVLSESNQLFGNEQHIRALLVASLPRQVPSSLSCKRQLLEQLISHTSAIPADLRLAFSAPEKLSESDVEVMIDRLVRLGVLQSEDAKKDDI